MPAVKNFLRVLLFAQSLILIDILIKNLLCHYVDRYD